MTRAEAIAKIKSLIAAGDPEWACPACRDRWPAHLVFSAGAAFALAVAILFR